MPYEPEVDHLEWVSSLPGMDPYTIGGIVILVIIIIGIAKNPYR